MVTIIFFIIYLSNIICIICINVRNKFLATPIIKKFLQNDKYEKLFIDYNINIQLKNNNNIEREFLINTPYIPNDFIFDFSYKGKPFLLNDTNVNFLSSKNYDSKILLMRQNKTFNNFIVQNKPFIKYMAKVIIVPKNTITNINIIAKYCLYDLSILLLELDEKTFNILGDYDDNTSLFIMTKKIELFPYKFLCILIVCITSFLFLFSYIFKFLLKCYRETYTENQISFFTSIHNIIDYKVFILILLYIEINLFYNVDGMVFEYTSFLQSILIFFMIICRATNVAAFQYIYFGRGINVKGRRIFGILIGYLTGFYIIFYILFNVFINPVRIPYAFYILSLIVSFPIFSELVYFSIKNFLFLCKAYFRVRSTKEQGRKYLKGILLKIIIVAFQFIILLIFGFSYLIIHEYLLFKKGFCFNIEKDILFQCLESFFILFLAIIYIPRDWPEGYNLYILMIHNSKKTSKINILAGNDYSSSMPKDELNNEEDIKKYERNNLDKFYVILNPKLFLDKNKRNINDTNIIEERERENLILGKNIKLGKIMRI